MYGLNLDTDVSFMLKQTLTQACFGQYDLILNFDAAARVDILDPVVRVSILVTSSIGCISPNGDCHQVKQFGDEAHFILDLLDVPVIAAAVLPAGTLCLGFEGGAQLQFYDDSDQFESYTISHAGKTIIV